MCNNSVYGGIVFPSFVANSCCNPCCRNSGSVGGTSNSNTRTAARAPAPATMARPALSAEPAAEITPRTPCAAAAAAGAGAIPARPAPSRARPPAAPAGATAAIPAAAAAAGTTPRPDNPAPSGALTCKPSENMSQPGNRLACLVKAGAPWYTDCNLNRR